MKTFIIFLIITAVTITDDFAQNNLAAKWHKDEYKSIDGIPHLDYLYNANEKVFFLITNDSTYLYINLKASDQATQKKIMLFGLTTWIDPKAKNKKQKGVKYPLAPDKGPGIGKPAFLSQDGQPDFQEMKTSRIENSNQIELIGFSGKKSSEIISTLAETGLSAKLAENTEGDLLYRIKIPLKQLGINYSSGNMLSINLESGEAKTNKTRPPGKMGERPGGAMTGGRRPGGNMQGGRKPGMMQEKMAEMNQLSSPIRIKIKKVKLCGVQ